MAFIELRGVSKHFASPQGRREVLDNVNLEVAHGEFLAVVGTMGSGKSTLLNLMAGLLSPDRGQILVEGEPLTGVRRDVGLVFQNYSLLPWFSALENVRLAVDAACPELSRAEQRARAVETLELVGLGRALERRPGQLSGGMRQRVAIARAFAIRPTLLFLDEPFGALDALTRHTLQQELAKLCGAAGTAVTTVMITNNVEEAILLADRIVPLSRGPNATLGRAIPVPLPRPRTAADLMHDAEAVRVHARIVEALTGGVVGHPSNARSRADHPAEAGSGAERPVEAENPADAAHAEPLSHAASVSFASAGGGR